MKMVILPGGGVLSKIINGLKRLYEKIKSALSKLFNSDSHKKKMEAIKENMEKDSSLKNKKIKIKNFLPRQRALDQYIKKLNSCKTPEQRKAAKAEYEKKKKIILAGEIATVAVTCKVLYDHIQKKKDAEQLDREYHKYVSIMVNYTDNPLTDIRAKKEWINQRRDKDLKGAGIIFTDDEKKKILKNSLSMTKEEKKKRSYPDEYLMVRELEEEAKFYTDAVAEKMQLINQEIQDGIHKLYESHTSGIQEAEKSRREAEDKGNTDMSMYHKTQKQLKEARLKGEIDKRTDSIIKRKLMFGDAATKEAAHKILDSKKS